MKTRIKVEVTIIDENYVKVKDRNIYFFFKGMGIASFLDNMWSLTKEIKTFLK